MQQLVDKAGAFVGRRIGTEAAQLVGVGQLAGQIEANAAEESRIIGPSGQRRASRQHPAEGGIDTRGGILRRRGGRGCERCREQEREQSQQ